MSLIRGLLLLAVFAFIWAAVSGVTSAVLRVRSGSSGGVGSHAWAILIGFAVTLAMYGLVDLCSAAAQWLSRRKIGDLAVSRWARWPKLICQMLVFVAIGVLVVLYCMKNPWYDRSSEERGILYFGYYALIDAGVALVASALIFFTIHGAWLFQGVIKQAPSGLRDFAMQPVVNFIQHSIGSAVYFPMVVLLGLIFIRATKQNPISMEGAVLFWMAVSALLVSVAFWAFGYRGARKLLLCSLEKSSIEAKAFAWELSHEKGPNYKAAVEQHLDLCEKITRNCWERFFSHPPLTQYSRYKVFLSRFIARGESTLRDYLEISDLLRKQQPDDPSGFAQMIREAAKMSSALHDKLSKFGGVISFRETFGEGELFERFDKVVRGIDVVVAVAQQVASPLNAERVCMCTRGAWLDVLTIYLDLAVLHLPLLVKLEHALERAEDVVRATANVCPEHAAEIDGFVQNIHARKLAVQALRAGDKDGFLKIIDLKHVAA